MPSRVLAGTTPAKPAAFNGSGYPAPCTIAIFSSSVICATSSRARCCGESPAFIHGRAVATPGPGATPGEAEAAGTAASDATASAKPLSTASDLTLIAAPSTRDRGAAARHVSDRDGSPQLSAQQ